MLKITWVALVGAFFVGTVTGRIASIGDNATTLAASEPLPLFASLAPENHRTEADVSSLRETRNEMHDGQLSADRCDMELPAFSDIKQAVNETQQPAAYEQSQAQLQDAEPSTRAAAVEAVVELGASNAQQAVVGALVDEDSSVRERALNTAMSHGMKVPDELVLRLAQTDAAGAVRFAALRAFAQLAAQDRNAVRVAAQIAVNDTDPSVQSTAYEILAHIEALDHMSEVGDFINTSGNGSSVDRFEEVAP